jgi:hypothetical protein
VAEEEGVNTGRVASAYRLLAHENLVEIRGRSGVFGANQDRMEGVILPETAQWVSQVVVEARRRRIKVHEFDGFIRRCTGFVQIRCACVETTSDALTAYAVELKEEWGFEVERILLDLPPERRGEAARADVDCAPRSAPEGGPGHHLGLPRTGGAADRGGDRQASGGAERAPGAARRHPATI